MQRSIATVSLSGTLEQKLAAAARAGFDGVEIFENDLLSCRLGPAEVRSLAADLGVEVMLYQPFRDYEGVTDEQLTASLRRADHKFTVMTALGADTLLVCSNVSVSACDDDARAANQLRQLAERASGHGIRIAFEALAWGRNISSYARAWQIVAAADHPYLGICLDSFHILSLRDDPGPIRGIPGDKIFFVQLADAPLLPMDPFPWSRHYRCFPGQGGFDLTGFIADVLAAGYQGPWSLEVFNDVFRQADAGRTAQDGMRSLLTLEDSLARFQDPRDDHPQQWPVKLGELPAAAEMPHYAFAELAVDGLLEQTTEHMLSGLGFTRAGRHRTKAVELWEQGGVRLLINRFDLGDIGREPGDALIAAIAMESTDPGQSAARAQALLAPPIPRRRAPDEADLTAVTSPDGTQVFFCRTDDSGTTGWLGDFRPLGRPQHDGPPLLTGVDHVALSQPFNDFDEATLFYQSLLGMRAQSAAEIASPYGLIRSRVMGAPDSDVRLVLNVPLLGGGRPLETAASQHIAFTCGDIFAAARALRSLGTPTLHVPGNYYEDLAARFDLDASQVGALEQFGIMYDRDEDGGELFHLYTVMLGRRLFFEVVQRKGGYTGYGTADSAIRMAAQLRYAATGGIDAS